MEEEESGGPCATCSAVIKKRHHLPIPDVCRLFLLDGTEVRRAVCGGCYKWALRHFTGEHARCKNGNLGGSCKSRFRKAHSLGVMLTGWNDDVDPLIALEGPPAGDGESKSAPVSSRRHVRSKRREPPSPAHSVGGFGFRPDMSAGSSSSAYAPPAGKRQVPASHRRDLSAMSGLSDFSLPTMPEDLVSPGPGGSYPTLPVGIHRPPQHGSDPTHVRQPSDLSMSSLLGRGHTRTGSHMSAVSVQSLDRWATEANRQYFAHHADESVDLDALALAAAGTGTASTAPPELTSSFSSMKDLLSPRSNVDLGDTFPLDGPDSVAAVAAAHATADGSDSGSLPASIKAGASAAPADIPLHPVLAHRASGAPHSSCSWVSFRGTLVQDVLRVGHPSSVTFRATGPPEGVEEDEKSERDVPDWCADASTFRFTDMELSVKLPTFTPDIFYLSASSQVRASGYVAVFVKISCKPDATGSIDRSILGREIMLAVLQVQPLMSDDDDI